jgi:hypothetical protein
MLRWGLKEQVKVVAISGRHLNLRSKVAEASQFELVAFPRFEPTALPGRPSRGSCPLEWCKSGGGIALSGGGWPDGHAAGTADSIIMGSSLKGAMVSRVM